MAKRAIIEDPIDHDRWLLSYSDFLLLLMAFFIVMYSISQVNESKYRVLSDTLTKAFNVDVNDQQALEELPIGELPRANPDSLIKLPDEALQGNRGEKGSLVDGVVPDDFDLIKERLDVAFSELMSQNKLVVKGNEEWLEIELNAGLLFAPGTAEMAASAELIINEVADSLYGHDHAIRVEGFTDNIPISTATFPTNWELSAARASAVVQILVESGFDPEKLAAVGYGEYQPKASNSTLEGRAKNRRVVLMVSRTKELRPNIPDPEEILEAQIQAELQLNEADAQDSDGIDDKEVEGVRKVILKDGSVLFTSGDRKVDEERVQ